MALLFVGERPSGRALALGATWRGGGLSASTLHDALRAAGIDPAAQRYTNVLRCADGRVSHWALWRIARARREGQQVVALGRKVLAVLTRAGIACIPLRHPGCRGAARRRDAYRLHVAVTLGAYAPAP
jgi:hypothetical protein